ncbi:MAG TPA: Xaa-Pro peptidase family protein [Anaerolineales bacterium]|nr:Xaa-Pro peptidase family protein [Anaerolineales bacterium]
MTTPRLTRLSDSLKASGLDALALNPGPSLVYLTGLHFHLMERPTVAFFTPDSAPALVLPELEMLKVRDLPFEVKAFPYGENPADWNAVFRAAARSLGLEGKRIGVEPLHIRLLELRFLEAALEAPSRPDFADATEVVGRLRVCKDADELAAMRAAVKVAQDALLATLPFIQAGRTEKEIAAELVVQLLKHGSQSEMPFAPIVSSGPNSANPHAVPSERKLQAGDLLVIDWGASVDGYISDLTRTFAVGKVDEECERIHRIVQQANAAGRAASKPGSPAAEVDKAARTVIDKSGYGQYFTHRTGHGIGMEPHEDPYMRGDNPQLLEPGMTYTVEPGIYLPGRNGVRIEDNVVITPDGAECLSDLPRELQQVG